MTAGDLDTGARIGRYVIVERVGTGAMGVVYGAYDPELDRKVALKLIKPGQGVKDTARARLMREAKAIARLQHPNVVAVHDVGVFEEQVFLAMEFVAGGTIKSWLAAQNRSWREILDVFIAAGRGLAAAHAAGLVHRDFKPDNVLLDKESRPRVVDFGIARQAGGGDDELDGDTGDVDSQDGTQTLRDSSGKHALATLTKTGTWVGTPAYMAPEQFLGERGDEKSDQFSFCVALYEALYGERPFAGDDMLSISVNVTTEQLRPLPKDRGIPNWVRRVILRGLRVTPADRWEGMPALIAALSSDPIAKLRNRLILGGTVAAFVAILGGFWQWTSRRHAETEREIARKVEGARAETGNAKRRSGEAHALRARAFAAFDSMDGAQGEQLWRQTRALLPLIDAGFDQAERMFEAAFALDQSRQEIRTELADVRYDHLLFAEEAGLESKARILEERLAIVDVNGKRRATLTAPGTLALRTSPVASQVLLERYERDPVTGRRTVKAMGPVIGGEPKSLAPGSYRLTMGGTNLAHIVYPFEVRRAERIELDVTIPPASVVPEGFAYVPPGEFWFGDADEILRAQFFDTVPLHRRKTDAYLIARNETTYGEWIQFLDSLPASQRARHAPNVSSAIRGFLLLKDAAPGWELIFQPLTQRYVARAGEPIAYVGRERRVKQDWLRFPVAGISPEDARQYAAWLSSTGRVPGARLCTEMEWERAARGADTRLFPHGDDLEADDANHDVTYGRVDTAYGPDVVGSHPASRSPFGVDDLAGNVWEFATSSQKADAVVIRGGSYYFKPVNCRISNREPVPPTLRDATAGIRICSSLGRKN